MSVLSIGVYGLAFGGWASNNKYSLLGGLRASAQLVCYELCARRSRSSLVVMMSGSVERTRARSILRGSSAPDQARVEHLRRREHLARCLPAACSAFTMLFICALAENNRLPFDLPECEAELVGGYHTEYSS